MANATHDIVDTAVAAGSFKTLVAAVTAAGLVETLKGTGPFTVFAPSDDAFAKLPAGTVEDLVKPENKAKLTQILTLHVMPGKVMAQDVSGKKLMVKSVGGEERGRRQHIGKGVVLDDPESPPLGGLEHPIGHGEGKSAPGRIVGVGLREEDFGMAYVQLGMKVVEVGAVRSAPNPHDLHLCQRQFAEQRIIAGVVDEHDVSRLEQVADDQVEGMVGPLRQEDSALRRVDRALHEHEAETLAKGVVALGAAVAEVDGGRGRGRGLEAGEMSAHFGRLHPRGGRAAVAGPDLVTLVELLAQQRDEIDGVGEIRLRRHRLRGSGVGDVVPGSGTRLQKALGDQAVVGLDHRVLRDVIVHGGAPHGGEPLPDFVAAIPDHGVHLVDDAIDASRGWRLCAQ